MYEMAHLILNHTPLKINTKFPFLREQKYNEQDESEAEYLGGCLQITRVGLDWAIQQSMSFDDIQTHFKASKQMVQYRLNMTGRKITSIK